MQMILGIDLVDPFTWPCIFLLSRLAQSIEIEVVLEESRPDVSLKPDTSHRTAAEHLIQGSAKSPPELLACLHS